MERAEEWGISTIAIPGNYEYYGYYRPEKKVIALATPEEKTFFHELCHASHEKIIGELITGQDAIQEIVAELGAITLCRLAGKSGDKYFGNSYRYIEKYAKELNITPANAVIKVISETGKVLDLILKGEEIAEMVEH